MPDKAIFLDRDDTIIEDSGYISSAQQVRLVPMAANALVEFRKMGYKLIVVTNQSGLARGLFTEQILTQIHERLKLLLTEQNAYLDRIYYCPFHPDGVVAKFRKDSDWRKPKPGMLLAASKEMKIDLKSSWMIGNDYRDIAAGKAAGCKTILIKSHTNTPVKQLTDPEPDFEAVNLREAVNIVKREVAPRPIATLVKSAEENKPIEEKKKDEEEPVIIEKPAEIQQEAKIEVQPVQEKTQTTEKTESVEIKTEKPVSIETGSKTEHLLEDIKLLLQSRHRNEQFSEFSAMKLMAGILQVLVGFCLVVGIWYKLSPTGKDNAVFTALGFATVLQLMSLTLFIMHKDR